ncbi:DNA cytosine methyltransferase [Haematobacter missouriensis]|uniref:DNA cytosine methyltransferase n=1 Tax=Haematobacter missouriensis TaxID=366616 RepID=UPI0023F164D0|nr:DNA cytosine methyltransferase [Haematobacter missouriensis]
MNENKNKNERLRPSMQPNKKMKSHVGRGIEEVQVIDFFSGCGGMSFGFHTATARNVKYRVLGGLDIDRHANATYERMLKKPAIMNDIRRLTDRESLEEALSQWGYDSSKPLILIGCAPCQGFSSHRKKDPREDERNELLAAFGAIVLALEPALVVMENVPEMLQKKYWKHYEAFSSQLEEHGYITRARLHNLGSFGVPQERYRALVLSSRLSHRTEMPRPTHAPSKFVSVRDAIGELPPLSAGEECKHDPMHKTSKHRRETIELLKLIPHDGGSRKSLPDGVGPQCHTKVDGFRDVYGRLWWDRPAVAITARCRTPSCGRFVHPTQDRGLSVREAGLLQGFPANYHFEGPFDDKFKQIGNAVAPTFARALAEHIDQAWVGEAVSTSLEEDVRAPIEKSISSALAGMKRRLRLAEQEAEVA